MAIQIYPTSPLNATASTALSNANQAEIDAQTGITNAAIAETNALNAQGSLFPNGRLYVPSAYWITTGESTTSLGAANDQIGYRFVQECSLGLTSVSFYVASVTGGSAGLPASLWSDNAGVPGSQIASLGSVTVSGAGFAVCRFSVQQLAYNTAYWIILAGAAGKTVTLGYNRNSATVGTGYSGQATSFTALAGAGTWTALTKDTLAANHLFILNPGSSGNPQISYGRFNGQYVPIPGVGLMTLPAAGLSIDTAGLTVSTLYYVYAYNNSSTLAIQASTTGWVLAGGIPVKSGTSNYVLLGMFYTVAGPGSVVSPIDCEDYRGVVNVYNQISKFLGKRQIYVSGTYYTPTASTWVPWNNGTDWQVFFLSWKSAIDLSAAFQVTPGTNGYASLSFGLDSLTAPVANAVPGFPYGTPTTSLCARLTVISETGLHYVVPMTYTTASNGAIDLFNVINFSAFYGLVLC